MDEFFYMEYTSPLGLLTVASRGEKITGLWIEGQKYFAQTLPAGARLTAPAGVLKLAASWLDSYFAGERPSPCELPLAPEGSAFRRAVWEELCAIPYGQTVSYGQLARRIAGTSARAAGGAVGHNPISIIIPCHRVLGAGGGLTGYAGGVERKQWLLRHEGAIR